MQLQDLQTAIRHAGGGANALAYAEGLLVKINRLDATQRYTSLLRWLLRSGNEGDFRGRVLEVNFADAFVQQGILLDNEVRQGQSGDIDFCWSLGADQIFIEMKMLGQAGATRQDIADQLAANGTYRVRLGDDHRDIGRIQRDIFGKSGTTKFRPTPCRHWINLVAIDVAELQLGMVDEADCVLAALGNAGAARYFSEPYHRPVVVGVFEQTAPTTLAPPQRDWVATYHPPSSQTHPRDYLHGVLYLFRQPLDRAALSYSLQSVVVWNPALVDEARCRRICTALHQVIPNRSQ